MKTTRAPDAFCFVSGGTWANTIAVTATKKAPMRASRSLAHGRGRLNLFRLSQRTRQRDLARPLLLGPLGGINDLKRYPGKQPLLIPRGHEEDFEPVRAFELDWELQLRDEVHASRSRRELNRQLALGQM